MKLAGFKLLAIAGLAAAILATALPQRHNAAKHEHTGPMFPSRETDFAGVHASMVTDNWSTDERHVSIKREYLVSGNLSNASLTRLLNHLDDESRSAIKPGAKAWRFVANLYAGGTLRPAKNRLIVTLIDDGKKRIFQFPAATRAKQKAKPAR